MRAVTLLLLSAVLVLAGCVIPQGSLVPAESPSFDFTVPEGRERVFERLLGVAQELNLSVDVMERASGFIQFKSASLSADQLDRYCRYPYVNAQGRPWDTYQGWQKRSISAGGGSVSGSVSISILLSEQAGSTTGKLKSTWVAGNRAETQPCSSLGVLEGDIARKAGSSNVRGVERVP